MFRPPLEGSDTQCSTPTWTGNLHPKINICSDLLLRDQVPKALRLYPHLDRQPTPIPLELKLSNFLCPWHIFMEESVAPSFRQLYQRSWKLFDQCYHNINQANNLTLYLPLSPNHIAVFVAYLHDQGYAPPSIVSYVSAIA